MLPTLVDNTRIAEVREFRDRFVSMLDRRQYADAIKVAAKGLKPDKTLERNTVWTAQTPQAFRVEVLEKIINPKNKNVKVIDDESEFVKKPSEVHLIEAGNRNMKIRTSEDFALATAMFNSK